MNEKRKVVELKNVVKQYKLYKNSKKRFIGIFFKRVKYRQKLAVNGVSFSIYERDSVAIFGKNGAGKSTILKMILGVTFPTSGEIFVDGRVSALLELTSGFDPELTGRENIYLKGQLIGLKTKEIAELEQDIIDFAEIYEYIDQPVRSYSSGMKARLGFAVNVNIRPEILIVDEALSVGDRAFRDKCVEKVKGLIETDNVTLLFVTHSTTTARQFCDRGIVIVNGKAVFDGDIDEAIEIYEGKSQ
ncbi:MAG: ABC transporter ATP-binding protein [Lentihominibacter sp.]|jgi:teichoic acid transport system ATP-binding protein